jgi:UDPglucose--hexose-1-phosphate uridylyltransferase
MIDIQKEIKKLASYALEKNLISKEEYSYSINLVLDILNLDEFQDDGKNYPDVNLEESLSNILDYCYEKGILKKNSVAYRDLLDTKIMNCFTPRPKEVITQFNNLYKESPKQATDYFYQLSLNSDYIREYRIKKDLGWKTDTPYGEIDITINLSKPEKDPKTIATAKTIKQTSYPKCLLCKENIGYRGTLSHPARKTIRYIPFDLNGEQYYMQYSPYSYYPEHCIVFNKEHVPMVINRKTFEHLLEFVHLLPHYMLGSNADLPIVGGSILTHDHYQGGSYYFPMFKAKDAMQLYFDGFDQVKASYLYWPLSVIRLKSKDRKALVDLSEKILNLWREYTDEESFILANTENTPHNTITPIAHMEDNEFVMDLTLRNNITTKEYPLGVYHPHMEYWNIKKENIGLIEVMGRAILPSRLKKEMSMIAQYIQTGMDISTSEELKKHASWLNGFKERFAKDSSYEEIDTILKEEIGHTFNKVLECCGVYKQDTKGYEGIKRFIDYVNKN